MIFGTTIATEEIGVSLFSLEIPRVFPRVIPRVIPKTARFFW